MAQFTPPSSSIPPVPALVHPPDEEANAVIQGALHDLNNLLLIIATYSSLAFNKMAIDSPIRTHIKQAGEAASQAALLSQQIQNALKQGKDL